jgi:pyruvate carboxylase
MDEPQDFTDFRLEENIFYRTTLTRKFLNRKAYQAPNSKKITAFIPGTILKVHIKEGHKVKKGDPLVVLQAMKMNNLILSTRNGVIKKIYVKQGETVPKHHLLLELK